MVWGAQRTYWYPHFLDENKRKPMGCGPRAMAHGCKPKFGSKDEPHAFV